jgi:hypothetical protein
MNMSLAEARAWRQLGEKIERKGLIRHRGSLFPTAGLCREVAHLTIGDDIRDSMHSRIQDHLGSYSWIDDPGVRGSRVIACELLALECEEEAVAA